MILFCVQDLVKYHGIRHEIVYIVQIKHTITINSLVYLLNSIPMSTFIKYCGYNSLNCIHLLVKAHTSHPER